MADAVRISTPVVDITDRGDNKPWTFASVLRNVDGRLVTDSERPVTPEGGLLVVDLVPGVAEARHGNKVYRFLVPEVLPEGHTLAHLLEAAIAYPVNTPQELLAAAVGQYVLENADQVAAQTDFASVFVRFVDQHGNPLPSGSVTTIHVNTVTGDIDDITFEEAP